MYPDNQNITDAITVQHVSKAYGHVQALEDISLSIKKGELFGMIGHDGAGKTTLFRILVTLLIADEGHAFVDGFDVVKDFKEIRKRIGYMPGRFSLYPDLTVKENLSFYTAVFKTTIQENYYLIEDIYKRLEPFSNRRAANLSGGMKQKLALCCALIHAPSVLFLDEPTTGVDPSSRREFWEMLLRLKSYGITILLSSAYMDEIVRCDRLCMMRKGKILISGSPQNIVSKFNKNLIEAHADNMFKLLQDLRKIDDVIKCYTFGNVHHAILRDDSISTETLTSLLKDKYHHTNVMIKSCKPTIEDSYMNLGDK